MARKFSDQEKQVIKHQLFNEGKFLFETYGPQKTNIGELTKKVGVAQGTFYQFYSSKEELYFEVIEQEEKMIQTKLRNKIEDLPVLTKKDFEDFLHTAEQSLSNSPIIKQLYDENIMAWLMRKVPTEKLTTNTQQDLEFFLPLIERWQFAGQMRPLAPKIIINMIRSLILLAFQRNKIGEEVYEETMSQFITMMAEHLVIEEENK
ncbi:AcrR family transcriptional regulator [Sporosarcina luteola]|nr:AcrR family transcriptional regulator [Sporosarcina luteola]